MVRTRERRWWETFEGLISSLLLLIFFTLGMAQARSASITFDEGPHLAVGYTTLRTGDFRLQPVHIHPPLANIWAALPLLIQDDLPDPTAIEGWKGRSLSAITDGVIWQYPHPRRIALAGRTPILLLGIVLGALVFRWAADLGGIRAGLVALTFYALDPNLIAHSALITTDAAAALLIVATLYLTFRVTQQTTQTLSSTGPYLLAIGGLLGLAQLSKVSALMLVPVVGLLMLFEGFRRKNGTIEALRWTAGASAAVLIVAALFIWAGYGFSVSSVGAGGPTLPAGTHIEIFRSLRGHYDLGHPTFALGKVSSEGWWWYFPVAFALKTPIPVLILSFGALVLQLTRIATSRSLAAAPLSRTLALALFPILYACAGLFSTVNIGYRHLLPLLPFLYVGVAQIARARPASDGTKPGTVSLLVMGLLMGWSAVGTIRTLPYPLTFFNELAGGPRGGYRYLVDSNLDWGQNLWDLQRWMDENDEEIVRYAHYSPARPSAYGVDAAFLPPDPKAESFTPWWPSPGLYAIGATVLQGPYAPDINTYAWFRSQVPTARLGNALFLYRVNERPTPAWLVLCGRQDPERVREQLGMPDLHTVEIDCGKVQVYPAGERPGLYLSLPDLQLKAPSSPILALRTPAGDVAERLVRVEAPSAALSYSSVEAEVDGPLAFLGYEVDKAESRVILHTYWRVKEIPDRPLSLMAHLLLPGRPPVIADDLSYPREQWRSGDIIVQRHVLTTPDSTTLDGATLLTGAYWLDSMERWPVTQEEADANDAIRIELH